MDKDIKDIQEEIKEDSKILRIIKKAYIIIIALDSEH